MIDELAEKKSRKELDLIVKAIESGSPAFMRDGELVIPIDGSREVRFKGLRLIDEIGPEEQRKHSFEFSVYNDKTEHKE